MSPTISVIIVNYFSAELTLQTIQHLSTAQTNPTLEIYVVDNSVCPQQQQILQQQLDSNVHLIINPENTGFGHACNQAYQHSDADWILLLNPDAYLLPDALEILYQFIQSSDKIAAVGPKVFWDDDLAYFLPMNVKHDPWHHINTWNASLTYRQRAIKYWQAQQPLRQPNLSGGHVLLRRSAVEAIGGLFDERFFLYYEDEDLFLRLSKAGYHLYCVPQARAVHAFNGCARDKTAWKYQQALKTEQQFMAKHYPAHTFSYRLRQYWHNLKQKLQPTAAVLDMEDLGVCADVPVFTVPSDLQQGWLIEFSLSPYFYPAVGHFGQGKIASYPKNAIELLPAGQHYVRLGAVNAKHLPPRLITWTLS